MPLAATDAKRSFPAICPRNEPPQDDLCVPVVVDPAQPPLAA